MTAAPTASAVAVLLPAHDADPDAFARTLASVRTELPQERIVALGDDWPESLELPLRTPQQLAGGDAVLAFARVGDRWRAGTLEHRLRPLVAHPSVTLGIAGHAVVDAAGEVVAHVPAPPVGTTAAELLLAPAAISAVAVKAAGVDAEALALLLAPHGEAAFLSRLADADGLLASGEEAADVRSQPPRRPIRVCARRSVNWSTARARSRSASPRPPRWSRRSCRSRRCRPTSRRSAPSSRGATRRSSGCGTSSGCVTWRDG